MYTINTNSEKPFYVTPSIEIVKLDNEISLAMESDAPVGPGEGKLITPENISNDPFKTNLG